MQDIMLWQCRGGSENVQQLALSILYLPEDVKIFTSFHVLWNCFQCYSLVNVTKFCGQHISRTSAEPGHTKLFKKGFNTHGIRRVHCMYLLEMFAILFFKIIYLTCYIA